MTPVNQIADGGETGPRSKHWVQRQTRRCRMNARLDTNSFSPPRARERRESNRLRRTVSALRLARTTRRASSHPHAHPAPAARRSPRSTRHRTQNKRLQRSLQGAPIAGTVHTRAHLLAYLISGCRRRKRYRVEQRSPRLGAACFIREETFGKSVLVQDSRTRLAVGLARFDDDAPAIPVGVRVEARCAERARAVPVVKVAARHRAETRQVDVDERRLAIGHKVNE